MNEQLNPDQERFMLWLEGDDITGHAFGDDTAIPTHWKTERREISALNTLLRNHLPEAQDQADSGFNAAVLSAIRSQS